MNARWNSGRKIPEITGFPKEFDVNIGLNIGGAGGREGEAREGVGGCGGKGGGGRGDGKSGRRI